LGILEELEEKTEDLVAEHRVNWSTRNSEVREANLKMAVQRGLTRTELHTENPEPALGLPLEEHLGGCCCPAHGGLPAHLRIESDFSQEPAPAHLMNRFLKPDFKPGEDFENLAQGKEEV
jgi:hypothetical protein